MGDRINGWIQRLFVPCTGIAAMALPHFGFGFLNAVAITASIPVALMFVMIAVDPGPRAKGFVEGLRNRLR
jgi:hypothetical protein